MLRKVALRFLVLIATSWLFPHPAGALDLGNGFPVGNWGNGVRPYVRVSAQDGRLSAIFAVVITPGAAVSYSRDYRSSDSRDDAREFQDRGNPPVDYGP